VELPKGKVNSNINVTPLVDVMLVLLIIFMVVTPMLGSMVLVPVTDEPNQQPESADQILIAMRFEPRAEGIEIVQGNQKELVALAALPSRLSEYRERNRSVNVVIEADARLSYGAIKQTMLQVNQAGFEHVGLITKPGGTQRKGDGRGAA
jgi:biopolymer transport protein TolR